MIEIQKITHENAGVFRLLRLRALKESPYAFSATYANESALADAEWRAH